MECAKVWRATAKEHCRKDALASLWQPQKIHTFVIFLH
jgi:hypothetical protein